MITLELEDELFLDWLNTIKDSFSAMLETMIRVAEEVKKETQLVTPIDTGKLSRSFKWTVVEDNSRFKILQVQMSALNERTGFDYAEVQHRGWHTSKNGWKVYYHRNKITSLGFFNYRKEWDGSYSESDNFDALELQRGSNKYLYWGLRYAEQSAFEIIETDYLSMFNGSFVI